MGDHVICQLRSQALKFTQSLDDANFMVWHLSPWELLCLLCVPELVSAIQKSEQAADSHSLSPGGEPGWARPEC